MSDIVERLLDGKGCNIGSAPIRKEAAAEIERLNALVKDMVGRHIEAQNEIERKRAALKPFAEMDWHRYSGSPLREDYRAVPLEWLQEARRALEQKP